VIALIALFISLGGTVYAAAKIDGRTIRKGSIPANRLKVESLTGAQINESTLGPVPMVQRAEEASRALRVERAASAANADTAARAQIATTAAKADKAAEAEEVVNTELATRAEDAGTLGGRSPASFLQRCEPGAVKAAILVDASGAVPTVTGFNCRGSVEVRPVLERPGVSIEGEYFVRLDGLFGGRAVSSAFGINSVSTVSGTGPVFRVRTFNVVSDELIARESFEMVVF